MALLIFYQNHNSVYKIVLILHIIKTISRGIALETQTYEQRIYFLFRPVHRPYPVSPTLHLGHQLLLLPWRPQRGAHFQPAGAGASVPLPVDRRCYAVSWDT